MIGTVASMTIGAGAWFFPASEEPLVWWVRIGSVVSLAFICIYYRWASRRKDLAPDFFHRLEEFFEKDGFTFIVGTEVRANVCQLCVYFQNRYERSCEATVMLRTSERLLAPQRHLPDAKVSFTCEPGAYGKATSNWPLPIELQGKKVWVDVMAECEYLKGRGELLRYRGGSKVGSTPASAASDMISFLGVVFVGIHASRRLARTQILLPSGVTSDSRLETKTNTQTLWKLGDRSLILPTELDRHLHIGLPI